MSASVDPLGNRITYSYDLAERQIALRNELNLATTTSYDAAGRPTTILDANVWVQTRPNAWAAKGVVVRPLLWYNGVSQ
jgi:YD repeat-containing protein